VAVAERFLGIGAGIEVADGLIWAAGVIGTAFGGRTVPEPAAAPQVSVVAAEKDRWREWPGALASSGASGGFR
jgi:hypothetical protein